MILRAQIARTVDAYHYTVRIPQFNKMRDAVGATPENELYTAVLVADAGVHPALKVDDTVLVAFENGVEEAPAIIGVLFNAKGKKCSSDASFQSLEVKVNAKFSDDVTIGKVTKSNIKHLEKLDTNVHQKFIDLQSGIDTNKGNIATNKQQIDVNTENIATNANKIDENYNTYEKHEGRVYNDVTEGTRIHVTSAQCESWDSKSEPGHKHSRKDITDSGVIILEKDKSYGSTLPTSGESGQLFFKIK